MNRPLSCSSSQIHLLSVLRSRARATAVITGSERYPDVSGTVWFYQTDKGVIVRAEISGLPQATQRCHERIFGFHIHKGTDCGGNMDDPFADAMSHYNPSGCAHPCHAGDLPPLFGSGGLALCVVLTNRFSVDEVIGRTIIIHDHFDDFVTQPSGNSGTKIACGVIRQTTGSCL